MHQLLNPPSYFLCTDINPQSNESAFATSDHDIFISLDDGGSWTQIGEVGISITP